MKPHVRYTTPRGALILDLRKQGVTYEEIAQRLGISKPTALAWDRRAQKDTAAKRSVAAARQTVPLEAPPPKPPEEPAEPLSMGDLRMWVSGHMRSLQAEVERCEAAGDERGAGAARRLLTQAAPIAARITPPDRDLDEGMVRVSGADMAAAALRCRERLHTLIDRVLEEPDHPFRRPRGAGSPGS